MGDFNGTATPIWRLQIKAPIMLSILLGNGDGTFTPGIAVRHESRLRVAVGDFNSDGTRGSGGSNFTR